MFTLKSRYFHQDERVEIMALRQADVDLHQHSFLEMVYIVSGQAEHTLNDGRTIVRQGDYFIIDYGCSHKYTLIDDKPFNLINVLFKPELIDRTLQGCRRFQDVVGHYLIRMDSVSLGQNPAGRIYHDGDGAILPLFRSMQEEYIAKRPGYIELIRCQLVEVLIRSLRTLRTAGGGEEARSVHEGSAFIQEYIDRHYAEPVTLADMSRELNFSLSYLCRRFRQETGMTFTECLQQRRMEQAARLLVGTDKKVPEVAEMVGYQDVKFFQEVFRRCWDTTPSRFRRTHGEM